MVYYPLEAIQAEYTASKQKNAFGIHKSACIRHRVQSIRDYGQMSGGERRKASRASSRSFAQR